MKRILSRNVIRRQENKKIYFRYSLMLNIFIMFFLFTNLLAQVDSTEILNDKIFQYLEDATEDKDDSQLYELFDELMSNPIDLNSANIKDLAILPFIPLTSAKKIIRFIKKKKGIKTFNELKKIKNIDPNVLILLKPFVKTTYQKPTGIQTGESTSMQIRSRLISDLQNKKGFIENKYQGNRIKSYQRLKANYDNIRIGGLIEKDAGEKSVVDFYSGFLQYKSHSFFNNFIVGDFALEFGQGLAVWSPYGFSKGSDATNSVSKRARDFIAYSSSDENNFFRGIASTLKFNSITLSSFYSQNKIDATLKGSNLISNLYFSGYHRTEKELLKKDNIAVTNYGASIKLDLSDNFDFSLLYFTSIFDKSFYFKNKFSLYGNNFSFISAAYNFYSDNISMSGEFSYNRTSVALINNIYLSLNKSLSFVTSVRSYPRNYFNIYSQGFGESNNTQNELGFYNGIKWKTVVGIFNVYYDIFKHPVSSFLSVQPSNGNDFLFFYKYKFQNGIQTDFKFKTETKEKDYSGSSRIITTNEIKSSYRFELNYKLTKNFYGKNRFEYVRFDFANIHENGFLTFQDLKFWGNYFSIIARIIFFKTDSYNSRIYEFENNHHGLLTNLPMYGNGFRWYFILNFRPIPQLKISARYSETYKPDVKSLGSGLGEIKGNLLNRFSLQVDLGL